MTMSSFSGVYGITDDQLLPGEQLFIAVEQALESGLVMLQYRSENPDQEQCLHIARKLKTLCQRYHTPLIINESVPLCLAAGAQGVHLGQSDTSIEEARTQLETDAIIGVTCHSAITDAVDAQQRGASYASFGRFFQSATSPDSPAAKLAVLQQAPARLSIPVVAIGGINADNCAAVIAAGANMVAVVNYLFSGDNDAGQRTAELNRHFQIH